MWTLKLNDGTRAILEGCTVDKITSPLPQINISAAEKEIKASQPQNKALQNLKCCPVLGGRVQILIGIKYSSIFPIPVHSLPNGLTIYRLQTSSHSKDFTAAIGGPHESFNQTMGNSANFTGLTHLVVNLRERIDDFRMLETSTLSRSVMTMKEEDGTASNGGMWWYSKVDYTETTVSQLHFFKKSRDHPTVGTED